MSIPPINPNSINAAESLLAKLIATPSISRNEANAASLLMRELAALGLSPRMVGRNVYVKLERGIGPRLMFCSHMDTVPPNSGYTVEPFTPIVTADRIFGLGSNDAGASLVSMALAAKELSADSHWRGTLELAFVVEEEVNGPAGAESLLRDVGKPDAAIIGEPTGLDVCNAQKGLIVLDCVNTGQSCHAANAWRIPHDNAILAAMRDIALIPGVQFAARDEALGPTTLNVTIIKAGAVHNTIPDKCEWTVDCRVNPAQSLEEVAEAVRKTVAASVTPRSVRLRSTRTDPDERIVKTALAVRPLAKLFGSDTMSDMVFFAGVPAIKCGPGVTEQSHRPDEYVERRWIPEGIAFYRDAAVKFFGTV